jgi:hypothetical protein
MTTARPANDNWEFGFSTYRDASGALIPADAFENDVGHYDGPKSASYDKIMKKIEDAIEKSRAEKSPTPPAA